MQPRGLACEALSKMPDCWCWFSHRTYLGLEPCFWEQNWRVLILWPSLQKMYTIYITVELTFHKYIHLAPIYAEGTGPREWAWNVESECVCQKPHQPPPCVQGEWTQEARVRFWLCLQLAVTLKKVFELSGSLFPFLGSRRGTHTLQEPSSPSTILPSYFPPDLGSRSELPPCCEEVKRL